MHLGHQNIRVVARCHGQSNVRRDKAKARDEIVTETCGKHLFTLANDSRSQEIVSASEQDILH